MENKFIELFKNHFQKNFWVYILTLFCICTGVVLGIYSVKYMSIDQQKYLLEYFNNTIKSISTSKLNSNSIFVSGIKNNLPILIAMYVLGMTFLSIPFVVIVDLIKGFTLGFTITTLIKCLGVKGVSLVLGGLIPQNIVYIFVYIVLSTLSIEYSISKIRKKTLNKENSIGYYTVFYLIVIGIMFCGLILEAYISPFIVQKLIK